MSCGNMSRTGYNAMRPTTCQGSCCRQNPSYFISTPPTLPNIQCDNQEGIFMVESWVGQPGVSGSSGISAVSLSLCDSLQFWTAGTMNVDVTPGSAQVSVDAQNIITGSGIPTSPPPTTKYPFLYRDNTTNNLWISDAGSWAQSGSTGPQGQVGATGPGPIGATGSTGPQGIQGIQGLIGVTGSTGPQGSTGAFSGVGALQVSNASVSVSGTPVNIITFNTVIGHAYNFRGMMFGDSSLGTNCTLGITGVARSSFYYSSQLNGPSNVLQVSNSSGAASTGATLSLAGSGFGTCLDVYFLASATTVSLLFTTSVASVNISTGGLFIST
uniref:Uncharacterized protein n=1 Tax=viral metagenome TaxID=1070528 RepID=A0A6C0JUJ9_9ZZZZ